MKIDDAHPFLELRSNFHSLELDTAGYWSYPALVAGIKSLHWLCLILPTVRMLEKKRTALFRPKALVELRANSNSVVRYVSFRSSNDPFPSVQWDKPIGMFPHKDLWGMTYPQLQEAENQLLNSYAEAEEVFSNDQSLPVVFAENYLKLLNPVYLPFLKPLAPEFFKALHLEARL